MKKAVHMIFGTINQDRFSSGFINQVSNDRV